MLKKIFVLLSLSLLLTGCQSKQNTEVDNSLNTDKEYKIGVFQYIQHGALDDANRGFVRAIEESGLNIKLDQQNASGDASTTQIIAQKLVDDKNDLIFAIATPAAQAVAGITKDIPIVITAVTDPKDAGLVKSNELTETNVTGTSDLNPIEKQLDLLQNVVDDAKTIGVLYCSAESNSKLQAELVKESCKKRNLEVKEFTVSSSNEIQSVVESMVGVVDAIYTPTDNLIVSSMKTVAMIANENHLPIISSEDTSVKSGALATYSLDYEKLGYKTGKIAIDILEGKIKPQDTAISHLDEDDCKLAVNEETAKILEIPVDKIK